MFFPFFNFPHFSNRLRAFDARRFPSFLNHEEFASASAISTFATPALELLTSKLRVGEAARKTRVSKRTDFSRNGGIRHRRNQSCKVGEEFFLLFCQKFPPILYGFCCTDAFIWRPQCLWSGFFWKFSDKFFFFSDSLYQCEMSVEQS
jgi:hypothetical protein